VLQLVFVAKIRHIPCKLWPALLCTWLSSTLPSTHLHA
jgi:hypothetical protein